MRQHSTTLDKAAKPSQAKKTKQMKTRQNQRHSSVCVIARVAESGILEGTRIPTPVEMDRPGFSAMVTVVLYRGGDDDDDGAQVVSP